MSVSLRVNVLTMSVTSKNINLSDQPRLTRHNTAGTAAAARAWSGYVDSLARGAIHNATAGGLSGTNSHHVGWAEQLDFLAAGVVILFTLLQAIGVRCSSEYSLLDCRPSLAAYEAIDPRESKIKSIVNVFQFLTVMSKR